MFTEIAKTSIALLEIHLEGAIERASTKTVTLVLEDSILTLLDYCHRYLRRGDSILTHLNKLHVQVQILRDDEDELKSDTDQTETQLDPALLLLEETPIMFLVRPNCRITRKVATMMRAVTRKVQKLPSIGVIYCPRRSFECEEVLREQGVWPLLNSAPSSIAIPFVPVENDLLTMELEGLLRECRFFDDSSSLVYCARAVLQLQEIYGKIPNIKSKGVLARDVLEIYARLEKDFEELKGNIGSSSLGGSVVLTEESAAHKINNNGSGGDEKSEREYLRFWTNALRDPVKAIGELNGPLSLVGGINDFGGGGFPQQQQQQQPNSTIDTLLIIDRQIDMISPLLTPLTYESLLDETFGIRNGIMKLDKSIFTNIVIESDDGNHPNNEAENNKDELFVTIKLFSDEFIYPNIKNLHVGSVMKYLNERARELKEMQQHIHQTREVERLQEFVKKIPEIQKLKNWLSIHIALTLKINSLVMNRSFRSRWHSERTAIEGDSLALLEKAQDYAARGEPVIKVLRLLCLYSVLNGGFAGGKLEAIRRDLIHSYGFELFFHLDALDRFGLLSQRSFHPQYRLGKTASPYEQEEAGGGRVVFSNFSNVKVNFDMTSANDHGESEVDYVFSGVAPLTVRVVQYANVGWENKMEVLKLLDGPTIDGWKKNKTKPNRNADNNKKKKIMVVFFVGGVTYAEIASLRLLSNQVGNPYEYVILTTKIINGDSLLSSIVALKNNEKLESFPYVVALNSDNSNNRVSGKSSDKQHNNSTSAVISNPFLA